MNSHYNRTVLAYDQLRIGLLFADHLQRIFKQNKMKLIITLFSVLLCGSETLAKYNSNNGSINEFKVISNQLDNSNDDDMKIVCYYGSWAVYRPGNGKFPVEEIDPFLCSHIIYGFAGLSHDNKIRPLDPYNDLKENWGKGAFLRFNALKQVNKKLKTLIAIGGWNEGSVKYSNMASNPEARQTFVASVVEFLEKYGFDGLDFDWEYPGSRGGRPEDKRNFVTLLKELKDAFRSKNYLLTAAVSAGKSNIDVAYDIPQVSKYLDIINVMCYDYHGGWESETGHNAPLYARPDEVESARTLNVNFSINYWISKGASPSKIVLGMGSYGRSFSLTKPEINSLGAPAPQKGRAGPYTREAGSLGYNEICEFKLKNRKIVDVWEPNHLAPYAFWERQWVGYDSIESIELKAKYAKAMGLGGGMVWSLETDDFRGTCGNGKYPLINTIKRVFQSPGVPQMPLPNQDVSHSTEPTITTRRPTTITPRPITTTPRPTTTTPRPITTTPISTTTTPRPTTTEGSTSTRGSSSSIIWWPHQSSTWWPQKPGSTVQPSSKVWWSTTTPSSNNNNPNNIIEESTPKPSTSNKEFHCQESGLFRDPNNCTKFIRCLETKIEGQYQLFHYNCPEKTVFNNKTKLCDWVENVPECLKSVPKYFLRGEFQINSNDQQQ